MSRKVHQAINSIFSLFIKKPIIVKVSGKISQVRGKKSKNSFVNKFLVSIILLYRSILIHFIDKFQILNQHMREELISLYGVCPEKIILIPNGISLENLHIKDRLDKIKHFGFVGRLAKTKKIDVLLEGFKLFLNSHCLVSCREFRIARCV